MNYLQNLEFLEWDAAVSREARWKRKSLRTISDPFSMDDTQFIQRYRLSKGVMMELCDEISPFMKRPRKALDISPTTKVLTALSYYATGSHQRPIGDISAHSVAQQTVSSVLAEVTAILNLNHFRSKYIKFPLTRRERQGNIEKFYTKFGMPGMLGAVDCSHVAIRPRPRLNEERYFCRKQYHSLNVQLICDVDQKIISVDASYGGATHDSFIWNNHPLKAYMEDIGRQEAIWLLGDSGYPQRRTMMTPILNAAPLSPEAHYTKMHCAARNVVERTIGVLKNRFRCLLLQRAFHYEPEVAGRMVNACVVLHNICVDSHLPEPLDEEGEVAEDAREQRLISAERSATASTSASTSSSELADGIAARRRLVTRLWETRSRRS